MGGVFGKSKKQQSRVTEQDKAVLVNFSCLYQKLILIAFDVFSNWNNKETKSSNIKSGLSCRLKKTVNSRSYVSTKDSASEFKGITW